LVSNEAEINEFSVAPQVDPGFGELPHHEWLIEFEKLPVNIGAFSVELDKALQEKNPYYADLVRGNVIQPLKISCIQKGGFSQYMKSVGKLGGQNKVPRLCNDRTIANKLANYIDN